MRVDLSLRTRHAQSDLEKTQQAVLHRIDQWCQELRGADSRAGRHRLLPGRHRAGRPRRLQRPRLRPFLDHPSDRHQLRDPGRGRRRPGRHRSRPRAAGHHHRPGHDHARSRSARRSSWRRARRRRAWWPRPSRARPACWCPPAPCGPAQRPLLPHPGRGAAAPPAAGAAGRPRGRHLRPAGRGGPGRPGPGPQPPRARSDGGGRPGRRAGHRGGRPAARAAGDARAAWSTGGWSAKIEAGSRRLQNTRFLHTEPHHDDLMLGCLPYIVRHVRDASNVHYFVTLHQRLHRRHESADARAGWIGCGRSWARRISPACTRKAISARRTAAAGTATSGSISTAWPPATTRCATKAPPGGCCAT